jgi:hypothetical protein
MYSSTLGSGVEEKADVKEEEEEEEKLPSVLLLDSI